MFDDPTAAAHALREGSADAGQYMARRRWEGQEMEDASPAAAALFALGILGLALGVSHLTTTQSEGAGAAMGW